MGTTDLVDTGQIIVFKTREKTQSFFKWNPVKGPDGNAGASRVTEQSRSIRKRVFVCQGPYLDLKLTEYRTRMKHHR